MKRFSLVALGTSAYAALFLAAMELIFVIAFTALIYSGDLSGQVPRALGFIILGDAVLCLVVALFTSASGMIAIEEDAPGIMLSIVAAGVIAALAGAPEAQFATVTLMVVGTSTLTGLLLLALGAFKLGGLTRFLPYPIIGGFLAGTGWLLFEGAIGLMTGGSLGSALLQWDLVKLWAPGFVLGVVIYIADRKIDRPYTVPALMIAGILVFYAIAGLGSVSVDQLQAAGWLLETPVERVAFQFALDPAILAEVEWGLLLRQFPALLAIALLCAIGVLLNSNGLELIIKKDIDLNRELVAAGWGNLSAGLTGGLMGYQDISFSSLNYTLSGGRRLVGVLTAVLLAGTLLVGATALLYIPTFIFGAALVMLGVELLVDWVIRAWSKFSRSDFLMLMIIFGVTVSAGFLQGIVVGLVLAVAKFAISYSKVNVVKFTLTGRDYNSRVTRSPLEQKLLEAHGGEILILKLDGFIFFGTANGIFEQVRERLRAEENQAVRLLVLDFAAVSGVDATGMLSFQRMMQWSREKDLVLVLTGLRAGPRKQFSEDSGPFLEPGAVRIFDDLDHGLEWCEDQVIARHESGERTSTHLTAQISAITRSGRITALLPYFQRRELSPGEYLIRRGEESDLVYFIESGQVSAVLEQEGRNPVRLETVFGGRIVGELGFYLGTPRNASVIVDRRTVVYSLSAEALKKMEAEDPASANIFHRMLVVLLSERVVRLSRTVNALDQG